MADLPLLDVFIVAVILLMVMAGFRVGLISSVFHVFGVLAGLLVSTKYYAPFADMINKRFPIHDLEADMLGFIVIFIIVYLLSILMGILLSSITRFRFVKIANNVGGSIAGLAMGVLLTGAIVLFLGTFSLFPGFNIMVQDSFLGSGITGAANEAYEDLKERLNLPGLTFLPEESRQLTPIAKHNIDFSTLDGATCFHCTGKVEFLGHHMNKYGTRSPKFICTDCGRTSDGCQTFEGYHLLYGECPAALGRRGYRFNCGIWTNTNFVRPTADCPVCREDAGVSMPGPGRVVGLRR